MTETTGFERFWNSTFGIPQQVGYRVVRALQDDRVSLLSERGLLDWSLVPILGIWDSDRYDVSQDEKWSRVGARLGLNRNLGTEIGLDLLTDPLSYLTAGLTTAGRSAVAARRAMSTLQMRKVLGNSPDLVQMVGLSKAKFTGAIDEVLAGKAGHVDRGTRRTLEAARREVSKLADEGEGSLNDVLTKADLREIQIGFPLLSGYGANIAVAPGYSGWTKFLLDKSVRSPRGLSVLEATANMAGKFGPLNYVLENTRQFTRGVKASGTPFHVFEAASKEAPELAEVGRYLTPAGDTLARRVNKRGVDKIAEQMASLMEEGADANTAFRKAIGGKRLTDKFGGEAEAWAQIVGDGVELTPRALADALPKWMEGFTATVKHFNEGGLTDKLTAAGEAQAAAAKAGRLGAFTKGEKLGRWWTGAFVSDVSSKAFREAERNMRSWGAEYTQKIGRLAADLEGIRTEMAKAVGLPVDEVERLMAKRLEVTATEDELQHLLARAHLDPSNQRNAKAIEHYASRLASNLRSLTKVAAGGGNTEVHARLLEALRPLYNSEAMDETTLHATYEGIAAKIERITPDLEKMLEDGPGRAVLLTGERAGKHLQFIPNETLMAERDRLMAKGERGPKKGRPAKAADLKAINEVLEARLRGTSKFMARPRVQITKTPQPARALKRIEVTGADSSLDDLIEAMTGKEATAESRAVFAEVVGGGEAVIDPGAGLGASLRGLAVARELRRAAKAGTAVDPELFRQATLSVQEVSGLLDGAFHKAFGPAGEKYWEALKRLRDDAYRDAVRSGMITHGAPIGYLSRVRTFEKSQLMDQMLRDSEFYQVLDTAMPRLGSVMRRNSDDLSVQDLNTIYRAFQESAGEGAQRFLKQMDEFADANGMVRGFDEYSEQALLPMLNRLAQGRRVATTMKFAAQAFEAGTREGSLFAGRVIARVDAAGERIPVASRVKLGPTKFKDGEEARSALGREQLTRPEAKGFVVELDTPLPDGRTQVVLSADQMAAGRSGFLHMGSPDFKPTALEYGEDFSYEFQPAAAAFAHKAAHGRIKLSDIAEDIESAVSATKETDYIAWGNRDALSGVLATVGSQWQNFGPGWNHYDTVHFTLKKLATVWRPGFLVQNLMSAPAQSMLVGASGKNSIAGLWDAAAFMSPENAQLWSKYDRFGTLVADPKTGLSGVVRRDLGAVNTEFLRVLRRNTDFSHAGPEFDQVAWRGPGGEAWTFRELAKPMRDLLLSSATREGLRGGARISGSLTKEVERAGTKLGKAQEAANTFTETAEAQARLSTLFALLREGQTPERAGRNALIAHVNYADLTNAERVYAKRLFGFYAFARKITPVVVKKFMDEPAAAAKLASLVKSGFLKEDANGQFVVDVDGRRLAVDRLNPSLDTLKMLEWLGESFLGVSDLAGLGSTVRRQEQVAGQTRAPVSIGGAASLALSVVDQDPEGARRAIEEGRDMFWVTRILFGETPEDTTRSEQIMESIIPTKRIPSSERTKARLRARASGVIGDLNDKMKRTADPELRLRYQDEIQRLRILVNQLVQKQ